LVTGWFSFFHGEATAGDLLAAQTVIGWLEEAGVPHDVAMSPAFPDSLHLGQVDPDQYTHLLFVCGPASGSQIDELVDRFHRCTTIAVGVSVVDATADRFDLVLERDSARVARPDLSLGARKPPLPPLVGLVRVGDQPEYGNGRHADVHRTMERAMGNADVAVIELGTRVEPRAVAGGDLRSVEAALCRTDSVVTTRLHGLVLALRRGVPAVAVDPVPGGAKVTRQARALHWPAILTDEEITEDRIGELLEWALTPAARQLARECTAPAANALARMRTDLLASVQPPVDAG
jgi:hypothetical protein